MSIFGDLREFLKTTLDGRLPVDKQVTMLMEAASLDAWYPPPKSPHGRPFSISFWTELLKEMLNKKKRGENYLEILDALAKNWNIHKNLLITFLKESGLWGKYKNCTLTWNDVQRVLNSAKRGSGIWTMGTKEEIMGMSGRVPFTAYSPPPPAASTSGPPPRKASTTAIDDPLTPIKGTKRSMFRQIFKMSRRFRKRGGQNGAKPR